MSADPKVNKRLAVSSITTLLIALVLAYLGNRYGETLSSYGAQPWDSLDEAFFGMWGVIASKPLFIDMRAMPLLIGLVLFLVALVVWLRYVTFIGNYRTGEESGSARWGTKGEGKKFKDKKDNDNNLLFTKNYGLALSRKKHNLELERNLNVLVIGGAGSGKTHNYVLPNICQLNSNYFITDPKGTLIKDAGFLFADNEYKVKSFNTINFAESVHYNPLEYVKTDTDILSFVNCFIKNTNGDAKAGAGDFWEKSEKMLYTALIALLRDWFPKKYYTLPNVLKLLTWAKVKEEDDSFQSQLDLVFEQIETGKKYVRNKTAKNQAKDEKQANLQDNQGGSQSENTEALFNERGSGFATVDISTSDEDKDKTTEAKGKYVKSKLVYHKGQKDEKRLADCGGLDPTEDFALLNYKNFKIAAGKTLKSIIVSCNVRLAPIATYGVGDLLSHDEMELNKLGDKDEKIVVFGILSDTDRTLSFLFAVMMWQAIDQLCRRALDKYNGKLPTPVHFIFDEFANIGTIPDIEQTIAVTRSRNIGMSIILQSISQLTSRYDKDAQTIIDCCDTTLFLGGKSNSTNKEIAEMIGKQTINQMTYGASGAGMNTSASKNMQIQGRDLIDSAEIGKMSRKKAILLIAGTNPLQDDKYPTSKHPRYKYIVDSHCKKTIHKKAFDFVSYMKNAGKSPTVANSESSKKIDKKSDMESVKNKAIAFYKNIADRKQQQAREYINALKQAEKEYKKTPDERKQEPPTLNQAIPQPKQPTHAKLDDPSTWGDLTPSERRGFEEYYKLVKQPQTTKEQTDEKTQLLAS